MGRLKGAVTYANAMATIAVFIALGGGAWAVSERADKDQRSQVMLATFGELGGGGVGNSAHSVVGQTTAFEALSFVTRAPRDFTATGLTVRLDFPLASGTRDFTFMRKGNSTALTCRMEAGDRSCRSNKRVKVGEGDEIYFSSGFNGVSTPNDAAVGWLAVP